MEGNNYPLIDREKNNYICPNCGCDRICYQEKTWRYLGICPECHIQLNWCEVEDIHKKGE